MPQVVETVAELQARKQKLEQKVAELSAKADNESKLELRAVRAEIREITTEIKAREKEDRINVLEGESKTRKELEAQSAVDRMISSGVIPVRDEEMQATWKTRFVNDPSLIDAVAPKAAPSNNGRGGNVSQVPALTPGRVTIPAAVLDGASAYSFRGSNNGFNLQEAMQTYYKLLCKNTEVKVGLVMDNTERLERYRTKGMMALDAANFYNRELKTHIQEWEHIPNIELGKIAGVYASRRGADGALQAADFNDPNNNLGVLTGTLVLQRTLPFFAYSFPELTALMTDFSDTPGVLNQAENTRIVLQPAVQKFNTTLGADNRPLGWNVISPGKTTNVTLTLTDYIAVPINFGNDILGSTTRRLFDEQAVLAVKAIAAYFVNMLTNLLTAANYNAYAVQSGTTVPIAYPTYVQGIQNFSMADLDQIDAAFTNNKVPEEDRGIFLTPSYYAKLRGDPRMNFYYMGAGGRDVASAGGMITEAKLPKLSGFAPYKSPYLPASTPATNPTTNNVVGWAFQKAGAILKSRLPNDFVQALGVMIPGSVTTVTDPDTKISLMLVQYVNLTQGYAEWRPEVELGASVGDNRAGLVLTSA